MQTTFLFPFPALSLPFVFLLDYPSIRTAGMAPPRHETVPFLWEIIRGSALQEILD